jgi:hypothetical protein
MAAGFRETGSLLVVAAPAEAEHVADVVGLTDGVVLVGDASVPGLPDEKVIARLSPAIAEAAAADVDQATAADAVAEVEGTAPSRQNWVSPPAVAGGALALLLVIIGIWFAARPLVRGHEPLWLSRERSASAAGAVPSTLDSIRPESTAAGNPGLLTPANAADSANAAAYAVVVARFNTHDGATIWLQTRGRELPSPTIAPFLVNGETWYRAVVGSYPTRSQADSLLEAMNGRGLSRADSANVIRAPLAFQVDSVTAQAVPGLLKYWAGRGQPFYALQQADGSARLYAGAFESAAEAELYLKEFPSGGNFKPVLVYRTGRVF